MTVNVLVPGGVTEFLSRIVDLRDSHENLREVLAKSKRAGHEKDRTRKKTKSDVEFFDPDEDSGGQDKLKGQSLKQLLDMTESPS